MFYCGYDYGSVWLFMFILCLGWWVMLFWILSVIESVNY